MCLTSNLTLFSVLIYKSASGRGIQIEYPSITLHAISRAESGPSIYCQLDESVAPPDGKADDEEITDMRELTIIPKAPTARKLSPFALHLLSTNDKNHPSGTNFRGTLSLRRTPPGPSRCRRHGR